MSETYEMAVKAHASYHECSELVTLYGGGIDGLLDDIAAGVSRNDLARKVGTSVRMLNRYITDAIPDSELQAAVDAHYASLIAEGMSSIRKGEDRLEIFRGKSLVEAAVTVAQFESPKYRPIKQDTKTTRIIIGGLAEYATEQLPVIDLIPEEANASNPA